MAGRRRFDSPWKTVLEALFEEFLQLFVPDAYADIDWAVAPLFLDKEFRQATRGARVGSRAVDQLVEVALRDGSATWVLVHIEIQAQRDALFARRMYRYHLRIFDHFDREPVSIALLADPEPAWRPQGFGYSRWDCSARLDFPMVKLTDWEGRTAELLRGGNPFGIAVAAHLAALATGRRPGSRFDQRKALYRDMRRLGVSQDKASALMTFMDWVLELPEELDDRFWSEVREEEGDTAMQYVTRFEQKAMERGRQEGVLLGRQEGEALGVAKGEALGVAKGEAMGVAKGEALGLRKGLMEALRLGLELKFGQAAALGHMEELGRIESLETLGRVKDAIATAASPADLRRLYAN
ncbi:MAG: cytosolic protein [Armatimonadetes bacterium]|nr:cytosolic protein [Armatimonadota bacterium]